MRVFFVIHTYNRILNANINKTTSFLLANIFPGLNVNFVKLYRTCCRTETEKELKTNMQLKLVLPYRVLNDRHNC